MDQAIQPDCSRLASLEEFEEYIQRLRNETAFGYEQLLQCRPEICGAVWGTGNPDISGVGVTAGYVMELAIAFCLAILLYTFESAQCPRFLPPTAWRRLKNSAVSGFNVYFDCAIYFSIAVELAIIVVLTEKDFGIGTNGFGAIEAQTSLAIAVLCMLPLTYPLVMLESEVGNIRKQKKSFRLFLFFLTALLFFYPFVSQCIHNWAPYRIGEGNGEDGTTIVTNEEWQAVQNTSFDIATPFSNTEHLALAVFELIASISIYLFVIWRLVWLMSQPNVSEQEKGMGLFKMLGRTLMKVRNRVDDYCQTSMAAQIALLLFPIILAIPLLWGIFRLRAVQAERAAVVGSPYAGNDWGFGQIVSIAIFAPVFAEIGFAYLYEDS